jgi:prepilin-type N-terminal cleavage/methylation domain-containing protein
LGRWRGKLLTANAYYASNRAGFTLLEILAVLLIAGLLMSVTLPNFGALQSHRLQRSVEQIVARIDFGRQRAVMTGIPHRLAIDLEAGTYKLEWMGKRPDDAAPRPKPKIELGVSNSLSLAPPPSAERNFQSLPGPLGKLEYLGKGVEFGWIEVHGEEVDFGEAFIIFEGDGTSSYTMLVLDEPGGREFALEILPLADRVRILDEEF